MYNMNRLFALSLLILFISGCKKEYKCNCYTVHPRRGSQNSVDYTYKEKKESDALAKCIQSYEESGLALYGTNCVVK